MKKIILFLCLAIFAITVVAFAAETVKQELRPAQKIMQARAASMKGMSKNLSDGNFAAIAKSADELAMETKTTGDKQGNPLAKDITLALSALAKDASAAATKKDAATVKVKLGAIKGKCDECHAKIRDKK
jgi:cytochrome c556